MTDIIQTSTREGDTVLDCFFGSGVVGMAALQTGRKFIGIELDPHYCEIAERRLAAVPGWQPGLF